MTVMVLSLPSLASAGLRRDRRQGTVDVSPRGLVVGDDAEALEVNEHRAFENLVGLHWDFTHLEIALGEERGDAVRDRPDMQAHELDRRTLALGQLPAESGSGFLQNVEGALGGGDLFARSLRQSGLEHHRVARRLVAGEGEIGAAELLEGRQRRGDAVVPGHVEAGGEALEAGARHLGEKRIAVAEMTVGRAASVRLKPAGPYCSISLRAASSKTSRRLPW